VEPRDIIFVAFLDSNYTYFCAAVEIYTISFPPSYANPVTFLPPSSNLNLSTAPGFVRPSTPSFQFG
jgi:hypothetical protein